jgi:uncharacterized protein (TIGR03663 family)
MGTTSQRVYDSRTVAVLAAWLSTGRTSVVGVFSVTLTGLLARLLWLGYRPMHFDEARVAYWILRANRTGHWEYRYIIHGPLVQHVNRVLFDLFGTNDFVARLPVAVVGAALPLAALLYRDRLRDLEVVALAGFLAFNPLLLYYSRFMRSDVLVGAFAFISLGFFLRLYETRRPGYLYAGVLAFAFAFASKENAIVYLLCWGGMLGLVAGLEVLDPRRFTTRASLVRSVLDRARALRARADAFTVGRTTFHAVLAAALFGLATVFMFAPRAPAGEGVGLYHSSLNATLEATNQSMYGGYQHWIGGGGEPADCLGRDTSSYWGKYVCNLGRELSVLGRTSTAVAVLAGLGVATEFRRRTPRFLVPAAFYWGVASLLGYPLGADIIFPPWVTLHAVIPLSIPAAAGLVTLGGWIVDAAGSRDHAVTALNVVAAVLLVGSMVGVGAHFAYVDTTGYTHGAPAMVQYAQPDQEMHGALRATRDAGETNEGLDVLVYGPGDSFLVDMGEGNDRTVPCMKFLRSTPVSWYFYAWDANVTCADSGESLSQGLADDPPVILTEPRELREVRRQLDGNYAVARYELRRGSKEVAYVFDADRVDPPAKAIPLNETER